MNHPINFETNSLSVRTSIRWSPVVATLLLACFVLAPCARAVSPAPDGGYGGFNTAEGLGALNSLDAANSNNNSQANTAIGYFTLQDITASSASSANTAIGTQALFSNTGSFNTAIGSSALQNNTTADFNTAVGDNALLNSTTGGSNTAVGASALEANTDGSNNTAVGSAALATLGHDGTDNTAVGAGALSSDSSGNFCTAMGFNALFKNTASNNTAVGDQALVNNTSGTENTATGTGALFNNAHGGNNTADGFEALFSNTASNNTADGFLALENNNTGHDNTAQGFQALKSNTTGSNNIAIGSSAGSALTTGSNNIDICAFGSAGESNTVRLGKIGLQTSCYIQGIYHATASSGIPVVVNSNGQLGTTTSSERFKEEIKPMDKASEAILGLKPVTFRYKKELDPDGIPQFGLVAEQVEKINPELVVRDDKGQIYTVRYDAVNAMLLNEFLKEHQKTEEQSRAIAELRSTVAKQEATIAQQQRDFRSAARAQQKEIETLTAGLQKVSAQVGVDQTALQLAVNNH